MVDSSGGLSHVVVESLDDGVGPDVAQVVYTRADDRLLSLVRPVVGESRAFHADGLGSVRLLTDASGVVTDRYGYSAFGELLVGERTGLDDQPYRFAGEPFDLKSGYSYNRARWLDVGVGRFLGMDPFGGTAQDPVSLHRYLYANVDPVGMVDPTGLFGGLAEIGIANGIRGILSGIQIDVGLNLLVTVDTSGDLGAIGTLVALAAGGVLVIRMVAKLAARGVRLLLRRSPPLFGFRSAGQFQRFSSGLRNGLDAAGFQDAEALFQGSSVTGVSFKTGEPFDVGRVSDFDIALAGKDLLGQARNAGVPLRSKGVRTAPLRDADLRALGLDRVAKEAREIAGREVNFMIFETVDLVYEKAPSFPIPRI